ncbi:F0F1 ATP synthase subunit A [Stomatohabitans albus]|uniref:F0F1 ATP synthase subunit A n=1 Tax=Stomatohabitans albus TaxID=3110766 RepID=UPI00300D220E
MNALFASGPFGGPFEIPQVGHLFNLPGPEFLGSPFTRVYLLVALSVVITIGFFWMAFGNAKIVPSKMQALGELVVDFVDREIAMNVIGPKGKPYVPLLTAMFVFILVNNWFKITPFVNFAPTGRIAYPLGLAMVTYVLFIVVAIRHQGMAYFKDIAFPEGVPWPVYFLLTPIELISTFILRPVTLTVRLFANMVGGHLLLAITFIATWSFLRIPGLAPADANYWFLPIGIITFLFGPVVVAFEMFIGFLQAYIFAILTAVYLQGAIEPAH